MRLKKLSLLGIALFFALIMYGCGGGDNQQKQADTSSSTSSNSDLMYISDITQNSQGWSEAFTTFSQLMSNPEMNSDWAIDVATQIGMMRNLAAEAEKITPSDKFKDVHGIYMQGIREYKWMADNLPTALDNMDADLINQCTARMMQGNEYINQASAKIRELKEAS